MRYTSLALVVAEKSYGEVAFVTQASGDKSSNSPTGFLCLYFKLTIEQSAPSFVIRLCASLSEAEKETPDFGR